MKKPKEAKEWRIGGVSRLHTSDFYTKRCAQKRTLARKKAGQDDSEFSTTDPILKTTLGTGRNSGWDVENGKGVTC